MSSLAHRVLKNADQPHVAYASLVAAERRWALTGGRKFRRAKLRALALELKRTPGSPTIEMIRRAAPLPPVNIDLLGPEEGYIVFLPSPEASARTTSRGQGSVNDDRPISRRERRDHNRQLSNDMLNHALGPNWRTGGEPRSAAGAASARRGTGAAAPRRTTKRLDNIGVILVDDLSGDERAKLEAQGAEVVKNMAVGRPAPPFGASAASAPRATPGSLWHLEAIGIVGADGRRVPSVENLDMREPMLGVIDTGVGDGHAEFGDRIVAFKAFGPGVKRRGDRRDFDSHGSHVTGLAAGSTVGVAHRVDVAVAAALTQPGGRGDLRSIVNAFNWLLDEAGERPIVINLSLGSEGFHHYLLRPIQDQIGDDVVVVAAIGNDGSAANRGGSPGDYRVVIGVGAADSTNAIAAFSSIVGVEGAPGHDKPDVYAPGEGIWSAHPRGGYFLESGTSMAAPLIAGLAILHLCRDRKLGKNHEALRRALFRGPAVDARGRESPDKRVVARWNPLGPLA